MNKLQYIILFLGSIILIGAVWYTLMLWTSRKPETAIVPPSPSPPVEEQMRIKWKKKCSDNIYTAYQATTDVVQNEDYVRFIANSQCDCYWSHMREVSGLSVEDIMGLDIHHPSNEYKQAQDACYEQSKDIYY